MLRVGTQNFSTANDPNYKDPMTHQWSLTFERQVAARQALRLTYSGFHSSDLTMAPDLNQIQPNTVGYANLPLEARPFPNWSRINTRDNGGYHDYHDLVLQLRGDVTAWGVSHTTAYKWAHSIDNIEDRGAGQGDFQTEINGRTDNRFDADYLRGRTTNIPDHRFVSSLIWNLPIGRGRTFGADLPAALDAIAGGWAVSTLVQIQSGPHLTAFYSSHCGSGTNCYGSEKVDAVSGQNPDDGPKTLAQWFNTGRVLDRCVPRRARTVDLRGAIRQRRERQHRRARRVERRPRRLQGRQARRARDGAVQRVRDQPLQSPELGPSRHEPHERELRAHHVAEPGLPASHHRAWGAAGVLTVLGTGDQEISDQNVWSC